MVMVHKKKGYSLEQDERRKGTTNTTIKKMKTNIRKK